MSIGARLYNLRVDNKLSRAELAEKFGVARNTVFRWEQDKFAPKRSALVRLADFYGVSVDWILNGISVEENSLEKRLNIPNFRREAPLPEASGVSKEAAEHGGLEDAFSNGSEEPGGDMEGRLEESAAGYIPEASDRAIHGIMDANAEEKHLITLFRMLSRGRQGRLLGYLDALCCEELAEKKAK